MPERQFLRSVTDLHRARVVSTRFEPNALAVRKAPAGLCGLTTSDAYDSRQTTATGHRDRVFGNAFARPAPYNGLPRPTCI
jgi:hypothetical protein